MRVKFCWVLAFLLCYAGSMQTDYAKKSVSTHSSTFIVPNIPPPKKAFIQEERFEHDRVDKSIVKQLHKDLGKHFCARIIMRETAYQALENKEAYTLRYLGSGWSCWRRSNEMVSRIQTSR